MVYRGPSDGCETCRRAKKKCDNVQPACGRCVRLKRPCPGLREKAPFQIRDESQAVAMKVRQKQQQPARCDPLLVVESIQPHPDDVALAFFLKQFAPGSDGVWSFLRNYATDPGAHPCLDLAFRACGMAALHNLRGLSADGPQAYARLKYTRALGFLHRALGDPEQSKTDETLVAVTILGYYEVLAFSSAANAHV